MLSTNVLFLNLSELEALANNNQYQWIGPGSESSSFPLETLSQGKPNPLDYFFGVQTLCESG